jgi:hypothetical protein
MDFVTVLAFISDDVYYLVKTTKVTQNLLGVMAQITSRLPQSSIRLALFPAAYCV